MLYEGTSIDISYMIIIEKVVIIGPTDRVIVEAEMGCRSGVGVIFPNLKVGFDH